jgi:hypothetical protein
MTIVLIRRVTVLGCHTSVSGFSETPAGAFQGRHIRPFLNPDTVSEDLSLDFLTLDHLNCLLALSRLLILVLSKLPTLLVTLQSIRGGVPQTTRSWRSRNCLYWRSPRLPMPALSDCPPWCSRNSSCPRQRSPKDWPPKKPRVHAQCFTK